MSGERDNHDLQTGIEIREIKRKQNISLGRELKGCIIKIYMIKLHELNMERSGVRAMNELALVKRETGVNPVRTRHRN